MPEPAWHLSYPDKPYDVQLESMRKSEGHDRFGLWLEQGMGKTSLVLNEYVERFTDYNTILVISPNSFRGDWANAPREHGLDFDVAVWPKDKPRRGTSSRPCLSVINYEALLYSGYDAVREIIDRGPVFLIVDESSAIKNFQSMTSKVVLDISKRVKAVRLLNGTPMTQNVLDLVAQLKCLGELDGINPFQFRNRYAEIGGFMGKKVIGVKNKEELQRILDRCSFRALKKDWLDLPEKIYQPLRLEMTKNQQKHYKEMLNDFYTLVGNEEFTANMVITQLSKLSQITSGLIMDGGNFKLIDPIKDNPKVKASTDIIAVGSGKVIVVHVFRQMGLELCEHYTKQGFNPAYIKGGMKPEELLEQKRKFNDDPTCRVIVCQIQSAYQGHTLLGGEGNDRSHITVFFDQTFSLLQRSQMEDRNHRGAQDRAVLYYDLIMSPIDEAQVAAITKKKDIAAAVVDAVRAMRI